ncbi:MAG: ATP-dependent zinc metalloprotease FtsH [bacterium]|nr:ATP-dependent zinc metalloprotease FtsH [bacterium]
MGIDISAGLRARLDDAEQKARKLYESGDPRRAAEEFRRCAVLMKELVKSASSAEAQKMRLEKARQYLELAKGIETGSPVAVTESERRDWRAPAPVARRSERPEPTNRDEEESDYASAAREFIQSANVSWDEIGGLEQTKREIQAGYAIAMASVPDGVKLKRSKGLLFFGPPGTGKTLLAAATSNGLDATFFNVKVSGLLSKYFGESSKLVTALFEEARRRAPSVVFIDEIDSLAPKRSAGTSGASKRVLSTLLAEMDGLATKNDARFLLTIGATNIPWAMDDAILSRFGKLIHVPLPDLATRRKILEIHLTKSGYRCEMDLDDLSMRSEGYSGRDIEKLCADAIEQMLADANSDLVSDAAERASVLQERTLRLRPITRNEMERALSNIKPKTGPEVVARYREWARERD